MRSVLLVSAALVAGAASLMASGELSGRRAPGFSLPDVNLVLHDLYDYRGKVVLLDFMQSGCPKCSTLAATLNKVKAHYGDKVAVLSVVNPPDNQTTVRAFIDQFKVTTPVLFDCGQMAASYMKVTPQNPTIHLPHLFIIDGRGMIRNDFAYSEQTRQIFEGRGLFGEIDRFLEADAGSKKK